MLSVVNGQNGAAIGLKRPELLAEWNEIGALAEADRVTEQRPELPLRTVILRKPFEPKTLLAPMLELLGLG